MHVALRMSYERSKASNRQKYRADSQQSPSPQPPKTYTVHT
jgi:hypothetical protein